MGQQGKIQLTDPVISDNEKNTSDVTSGKGAGYKEGTEVDTRCGYGGCKPNGLQKCNNPKVLLLLLCILNFAQGFSVNGINNVNTSMMERRFQLPSSRVATISSSYDFSAAVFGVVISFFASGRNKAKWLSMAAFALATGSFLMSLPHFITGPYEWGQDISFVCNGISGASGKCTGSVLQSYLALLIAGMVLNGLGGAVLYTVGVGYIDDSVPANDSPMYLSIFYGSSLVGPGLGYIVGGQLLNVYVDFDKVDTRNITLTPADPRWVGAWWVGFIVTSTLCFLVALPLSLFGQELPTAKQVRDSRVSQRHKGKGTKDDVTSSRMPIKELPKAFWELITSVPFVCVIFAGASQGISSTGLGTFIAKFIQNGFGVSAGLAATLTGSIAVPGAAGGVFFGGFICKRYRLKVTGMLKFCIGIAALTVLFSASILVTCGQQKLVGLTEFSNDSISTDGLLRPCNQDCSCTTEFYVPVCDESGNQFFSACHAGCQNRDGTKFTNCSCVDVSSGNDPTVSGSACDSQCRLLYVFLSLSFCLTFLTFANGTPGDAAALRFVNPKYRTFSMGMKWLVIRLCGTVPGPVVYGAATDTACLVWENECGENTSCWIYDTFAVKRNYFLISLATKVASLLLFIGAFWFYKPPQNDQENETIDVSFVNGAYTSTITENQEYKSVTKL